MWGENESMTDYDEENMVFDEAMIEHFCVLKIRSQNNFTPKKDLEYDSDDMRNYDTE